jgi:hypothetical protein
LARNQLDLVIGKLRSVKGQRQPDEIERMVDVATSLLQHISELIGR